MRILIVLLFLGTGLLSQPTIIHQDGSRTIEGGLMYSSPGQQLGIYGAYNGMFRGELAISKYTNSFSASTMYSVRATLPIIKQGESLPFNAFADAKFNRFQSSGSGSNSFQGSVIVSHLSEINNWILSPFLSAGYLKYSSGGQFKWSLGAHSQVQEFILGLELGRSSGSTTTYFTVGYKFGLKRAASEPESALQDQLDLLARQDTPEQEAERQRVIEDEPNELQSDTTGFSTEAIEENIPEQPDLPIAKNTRANESTNENAEEEKPADNQPDDNIEVQEIKIDEQQKQEEQRLEQLKLELEKLVEDEDDDIPHDEENVQPPLQQENQLYVQFFASKDGDKDFEGLGELGQIMVVFVPEQNVYRYLIGSFPSREEAEYVIRLLDARGYEDAFIRNQ